MAYVAVQRPLGTCTCPRHTAMSQWPNEKSAIRSTFKRPVIGLHYNSEKMKNSTVNLVKLVEDFSQLEQKITELKGKNSFLANRLEETTRLMKLSQTKEEYTREERNGFMEVINGLQHTLQLQCDLRVENEDLKNTIVDIQRDNKAKLQDSDALVETLRGEMCALTEAHQRETDELRQMLQREVDEKESVRKEVIEGKECELEEMRRKMKDREREKQSEIVKLQMEFSTKLARVQASACAQPTPRQVSCLPQNIFKRKLQFIQEEKSREIEALKRKVRELEQQLDRCGDSHPKRKKV